MRFWRKKNEGFEWHKYVRTTILQRREQRRNKVERAKVAAADGVRAAGAAAVAGSRDGSLTMSRWLGWLTGALVTVLRYVGALVVRIVKPVMRPLGRMTAPLWSILCRPQIANPLAVFGVVAIAAGLIRVPGYRLDRFASFALVIGIVALLLGLVPRWLDGQRFPVPKWLHPHLARLPSGRVAVAIAGLAVAGGGWLAYQNRAQMAAMIPSIGTAQMIEGRGMIVSAEIIRINGQTMRLAGIEAPEREQRCTQGGKRAWTCGQTAEQAVAKMVSGRALKCEIAGKDDAGRPLAVCRDGASDINARLVRDGAVFAAAGLFSRYSSQEGEARAQKAGLWKGEAERPSAYRAKRWDEAKRKAPDGCPIKGHVASGAKTYVLPWAASYDRVQVQKRRGERWFCTEQEAREAGWKAAEAR